MSKQEKLRKSLVKKLNPARFPNMSGKMAAILGYLLGETFTAPYFSDMTCTSDGFILGQNAGDIGMNEFLGAYSDLEQNWKRLLDATPDLTAPERKFADQLLWDLHLKGGRSGVPQTHGVSDASH